MMCSVDEKKKCNIRRSGSYSANSEFMRDCNWSQFFVKFHRYFLYFLELLALFIPNLEIFVSFLCTTSNVGVYWLIFLFRCCPPLISNFFFPATSDYVNPF